MSSVEKKSPDEMQDVNEEQSAKADGLKSPPPRPTLVAPPPRPIRPATPKAKAVVAPASIPAPPPAEPAPAEPPVDPLAHRYLPIAPPSEPMQYRAIGLVRGTYAPTEDDQLNRGNLTTDDGQVIDSVLLGRVTSLVKKHLDLATSHLWVVYPRTRRELDINDDQDLHLQIVGVWEPETLGLPGESPASEATPAADAAATESSEASSEETAPAEPSDDSADTATGAPTPGVLPEDLPAVDDNFFSIRGEVVKHEPETRQIMVKILQGVKRTPGAPKSFKLMLNGDIEGRTVGYFWDFQVKRAAKALVVESASVVGIVPPKKRSKGGGSMRRGPGGGGRRPGSGERPGLPNRRPTADIQGSPRPKKPGPKPENLKPEAPEA